MEKFVDCHGSTHSDLKWFNGASNIPTHICMRLLVFINICTAISEIRLPYFRESNICKIFQCSGNCNDLSIYKVFISRLNTHFLYDLMYKGTSKVAGLLKICLERKLERLLQGCSPTWQNLKGWLIGLTFTILFAHSNARPMSNTYPGFKIHLFTKLKSPWVAFPNPEMNYTCPIKDKVLNQTIVAREYKCHTWEKIVCMDSDSVGRVFFCIPKSTYCSIGIGWTVEGVDDDFVKVKESSCQEGYYQIEPSRCYTACRTKHELPQYIPPQYKIHTKGDNKGPAMLKCNDVLGFYSQNNNPFVAFDSNLPADFCINVNTVNPCSKEHFPLYNGTCLNICSKAYQELVTDTRCKKLSSKAKGNETKNKDIQVTSKPVNSDGISTRKRNEDYSNDKVDKSRDINDEIRIKSSSGITLMVTKAVFLTIAVLTCIFIVVVIVVKNGPERKKKHNKSLEVCNTGGEKFKKPHDDTCTQLILGSLYDQMKYVGALMRNGGLDGTVFRVGSRYVMTAYHVIQPIIWDSMLNDIVPKRLFDKSIFVNFNAAVGDPPHKLPHIKKICYINTELDVVILQLSTTSGVPGKLLLWKGDSNLSTEKVTVIGYGNQKQPFSKHLDLMCCVVKRNSSEVTAALEYYEREKDNFKRALPDNTEIIDNGYDEIDNARKILFHGFLEHGASGSPLLVCNDARYVYVVGILTHGIPEFFYRLPTEKQVEFPKNYRFHSGSRMQLIYEDLKSENRALADDIFC